VSGNTENDPTALPSGSPTVDPESAIGKMTAKARQAGADAAALTGEVVEDARSRGESLAADVKDHAMAPADGQREEPADQVSDVADAVIRPGNNLKETRTGSRTSLRPAPLNLARLPYAPMISRD